METQRWLTSSRLYIKCTLSIIDNLFTLTTVVLLFFFYSWLGWYKKKKETWAPTVWRSDFRNHVIVDGLQDWPIKVESIDKHRISQNWPLFEWNPFFGGKRNVYLRGTFLGSLHKRLSQTTWACQNSCLRRWQSWQKPRQVNKKLATYPNTQSPAVSRQLKCVRWYAVLQILPTQRWLQMCRCMERQLVVQSSCELQKGTH